MTATALHAVGRVVRAARRRAAAGRRAARRAQPPQGARARVRHRDARRRARRAHGAGRGAGRRAARARARRAGRGDGRRRRARGEELGAAPPLRRHRRSGRALEEPRDARGGAARARAAAHVRGAAHDGRRAAGACATSCATGRCAGLNVTVPHKPRVLDLVDAVDESARSVGAANTLVRSSDGKVRRTTRTSPPSPPSSGRSRGRRRMVDAPRPRARVRRGRARRDRRARIARGHGRRGEGPAPGQRTAAVGAIARERALYPRHRPGDERGDDGRRPRRAGRGGRGVGGPAARRPSPSTSSTRPPETPFLRGRAPPRPAERNGLGMLARQGALAFELWLGVPAPLDVMLAALELP